MKKVGSPVGSPDGGPLPERVRVSLDFVRVGAGVPWSFEGMRVATSHDREVSPLAAVSLALAGLSQVSAVEFPKIEERLGVEMEPRPRIARV